MAAYDGKALGLEFFLQFLQMRHAGDAGRAPGPLPAGKDLTVFSEGEAFQAISSPIM